VVELGNLSKLHQFPGQFQYFLRATDEISNKQHMKL